LDSIIAQNSESVEECGGLDDFLAGEIAQTCGLSGGPEQFGGLEAGVEVWVTHGGHDMENGFGGLAQAVCAYGIKLVFMVLFVFSFVISFVVFHDTLLYSLS
jgi:hypothetical protein